MSFSVICSLYICSGLVYYRETCTGLSSRLLLNSQCTVQWLINLYLDFRITGLLGSQRGVSWVNPIQSSWHLRPSLCCNVNAVQHKIKTLWMEQNKYFGAMLCQILAPWRPSLSKLLTSHKSKQQKLRGPPLFSQWIHSACTRQKSEQRKDFTGFHTNCSDPLSESHWDPNFKQRPGNEGLLALTVK